MKTTHPDIAGRRFSTPQGSEESFDRFLEGFETPRHELLAELGRPETRLRLSLVANLRGEGGDFGNALSRRRQKRGELARGWRIRDKVSGRVPPVIR